MVELSKAVEDDSDEENDEIILKKYNNDNCLDYIIGNDMVKVNKIAETKNTYRLDKALNKNNDYLNKNNELLKKFNQTFREWVELFHGDEESKV